MSCAVITGASRGIGRGIALTLAKGGHNIVINYRTENPEIRPNLSGADLRGKALVIIDLSYTNFSGADLSETSLGNLEGADLTDTNLSNADLIETKLNDANLTRANLTGDLAPEKWSS